MTCDGCEVERDHFATVTRPLPNIQAALTAKADVLKVKTLNVSGMVKNHSLAYQLYRCRDILAYDILYLQGELVRLYGMRCPTDGSQ